MKSSEPEDNQISEEELKEQLDEIVSSMDKGTRDTTLGAVSYTHLRAHET